MKKIIIISLLVFLIGWIGFFILHPTQMRSLFSHIGALGSLSLLAWLTGIIARKRGFKPKKAYSISLASSAIIGIIAVYVVDKISGNAFPSSCGGVVSLGIAFILLFFYLLRGKTKDLYKKLD